MPVVLLWAVPAVFVIGGLTYVKSADGAKVIKANGAIPKSGG